VRSPLAAAALLLLPLLLPPSAARAEPQFALREGLHCGACHVNVSGGGMRTDHGVSFSHSDLPTLRAPAFVNPRVADFIALGADLRTGGRFLPATRTELQGVEWERPAAASFEMPEANLYLRLEPVAEHLAVYLDETFGPEGAANREAFVLLWNLPGGGYVKGGRFMLPFGLRLRDDEAFIRRQTGFTYDNQDLGFELGLLRHPLQASFAVSNGTDGGVDVNTEKRLTGQFALAGPWLRGGASASWNDASAGGFVFRALTAGGHLGLRLGRLVAMAEFDWVHGSTGDRPYDQWSLYSSFLLEAWKGLWLRFTFESYDPLVSMEENERDRFVWELAWFPMQFLELRASYRLNRDIPQRIEGNVDEFLIEIHGFL